VPARSAARQDCTHVVTINEDLTQTPRTY